MWRLCATQSGLIFASETRRRAIGGACELLRDDRSIGLRGYMIMLVNRPSVSYRATCRSAVQNSLNDAPFAFDCVHCILKVANILYRCRKQGRTRVMWPLTHGLKTRLRVACASLIVFSCNGHPLSLAPPQLLVRLSLLLSYYTKSYKLTSSLQHIDAA